jgi:threonyl-tRNA synthetase
MKDHREIGRELDLFSFHEFAPGAVFWHPKGWTIYKTLVDFIRTKIEDDGYLEISTPVMIKNQLFKDSGHWEHFGEHNMFNLSVWEESEIEEIKNQLSLSSAKQSIEKLIAETDLDSFKYPIAHTFSFYKGILEVSIVVTDREKKEFTFMLPVNYSLKPMNCPESALVYKAHTQSYSNLPIKLSELGTLHRRELSGVLGGLLRVRQFTIDDAHLFVTQDQIQDEIQKLIELVLDFYKSLNFKPRFFLATMPQKALGDKEAWDKAESDLEKALKKSKVKYDVKKGDGAFYGPKIDIHINDSQKRDWQLATIQLDFQIPQMLNLEYVDKDGTKKRPVMIHRGIFGSIERFIGILLEHLQGNLPVWLSPVQSVVLPISDKHITYAKKIAKSLKEDSIRVEVDKRNETLQAKIRDATIQKTPYLLVVGEKEESSNSVAVRTRSGEDLGKLKIDEFKKKLQIDIDKKS